MNPLHVLPLEVWTIIFYFSDIPTKHACGRTCHLFRMFWRSLLSDTASGWVPCMTENLLWKQRRRIHTSRVVPLLDDPGLTYMVLAICVTEDLELQHKFWNHVTETLLVECPLDSQERYIYRKQDQNWYLVTVYPQRLWKHVQRVVGHWLGRIASQSKLSAHSYRQEYLVRSSNQKCCAEKHRRLAARLVDDAVARPSCRIKRPRWAYDLG